MEDVTVTYLHLNGLFLRPIKKDKNRDTGDIFSRINW